jgi:hypothetical protein
VFFVRGLESTSFRQRSSEIKEEQLAALSARGDELDFPFGTHPYFRGESESCYIRRAFEGKSGDSLDFDMEFNSEECLTEKERNYCSINLNGRRNRIYIRYF